ncbi:MAG: polysaccharide deacetylase family protein, partial [Actinobacteria bacterium]|nr:polysaccharide deacetylase family protein [Actinomycetota bacterium]
MAGARASEGRWGPQARSAAVSITFDNLGEAMDLALGTWPEDQPLGRHHSVTRVLPRILSLLDGEGLRSTYFVEGWSAAMYPDAIRRLHDAGHEIGCHGWRHERWSQIASRDMEATLISRAVAAIGGHGIQLRGFRPPGGELSDWSAEVLRQQGFAYVSPAARRLATIGGLVALPFRWKAIDAYYLYDAFASLRAAYGDPEHALPPRRLVDGVEQVLDEIVSAGGYVSLLFHPFLHADGGHFTAMEQIIAAVAKRDDVWCATCAEHVDWVLRHPELLAADPELENVSWQEG